MKARCYDPAFKYRTAVETDIRKTFARIRREEAEKQRAEQEKPLAQVTNLPRKTK